MNETAEQATQAVQSAQDKELLQVVVSKLEYQPLRDLLVKPLDEVIVTKEINETVETGEIDEATGMPILDVKTSTEEVPANFRKAIILAVPSNHQWPDAANHPEVGDTIAYVKKHAIDFDLFKTSQLVSPFNVVAFIKK